MFNHKPDAYLTWGWGAPTQLTQAGGVVCNMTTHTWQMCLSTAKQGRREGDTVSPPPPLELITQAGHCPEPFSSSLELPW